MTTAVVTGANRGIGLEFCRQLKARGYDVVAACRHASTALTNLGVQVEEGVDVTDDRAIDDVARRLSGTNIDLLINNAGILAKTDLGTLNPDTIRSQFEVNALGPLRVTHALLPYIRPHGKVALITSRMGSIHDNTSGGSYGYRMSKAALNIAGKSLAHDLHSRQICVALLHPGYVKTDMTQHSGPVTPRDAVTGLMARIDDLNLDNSGTFWHANGDVLPW